jgi:hypothetical protein
VCAFRNRCPSPRGTLEIFALRVRYTACGAEAAPGPTWSGFFFVRLSSLRNHYHENPAWRPLGVLTYVLALCPPKHGEVPETALYPPGAVSFAPRAITQDSQPQPGSVSFMMRSSRLFE